MVICSSTLFITYDELEKMFNEALNNEITEWREEKEEFFKDPFNKENDPCGKYMPSAIFQIWLDLPKNMVSFEDLNKLIGECGRSGWEVESNWKTDERTGADQLYFLIKKSN